MNYIRKFNFFKKEDSKKFNETNQTNEYYQEVEWDIFSEERRKRDPENFNNTEYQFLKSKGFEMDTLYNTYQFFDHFSDVMQTKDLVNKLLRSCVVCKTVDEWYFVTFRFLKTKDNGYDEVKYYICDKWEGLTELINKFIK